jgi:hypothetical protein
MKSYLLPRLAPRPAPLLERKHLGFGKHCVTIG